MDDDEVDKEMLNVFSSIVVHLDRIANAMEARAKTDQQGMELAKDFTGRIKLIIEPPSPPTVGDVVDEPDYDPELDPANLKNLFEPPTVGDVVDRQPGSPGLGPTPRTR